MDYHRVTFIGWYLLAVLVLLCIICLMSGCRTQYVPVETVRTEYVNRTDTFIRTDSIVSRDSVFVRQNGDTVWLERWHTMYKDRLVTKTVTDTVIKIDSIQVPYPVERQATRWERLKDRMTILVLCALCLVVAIYWLRSVVRRRR